ncbi:hypothetical protein [Roseinatronobacter sp. S2]|uniref:hypothetical protein n=1 Tax=Roseinatronobacter sp. S2 TaxID=3035471 RepID=UPI00240F2D66|nr:hypothetical protein [Roseinatronobacter sp. S2]WFE76379.1 hypothetical protein P8S53_08235 [Roseinatronobacter sp. S2]
MDEDFTERLFTHFVGGAWRAPLGTYAMPVTLQDGHVVGQVIAAEQADIARLCRTMRGADPAARTRFATLIARAADDLARALAAQGANVGQTAIAAMSGGVCHDHRAGGAPVCLCASVGHDPIWFGQRLGEGVSRGVAYCPPPNEVLFATLLAGLAAQADLPPGAFNLLHGDNARTKTLLTSAGVPCL